MVFFTCDACGESLKKGAVEKHYQFQCRNCSVLSCVDCGKDFYGYEYKEHVKCISEEEKYSGKDYKPKANANKGEIKQNQWIQQVQSAISKCRADPKLKTLLERLIDYPNIPRKKAKFENFIRNSLAMRDNALIERTWTVIAAELTQGKNEGTSQMNGNTTTESKTTEKPKVEDDSGKTVSESEKMSKRDRKEERRKKQNKEEKKERKRKRGQEEEEESEVLNIKKKKSKKQRKQEAEDNCEEEEVQRDVLGNKPGKKKKKTDSDAQEEIDLDDQCEGNNDEEKHSDKFSWEGVIIGILKREDENELSLKRLRKKVLAEYFARAASSGRVKSEEELMSKFTRKITKNPRVRVLKDRAKLLR